MNRRETIVKKGEYKPVKKANLKKKKAILVAFEDLKSKISITVLSAIVSVFIIPYVQLFDVTIRVDQFNSTFKIGTLVDYIFITLCFYLFFTILVNLNKRKSVRRWEDE
jgi:hypothetical protein